MASSPGSSPATPSPPSSPPLPAPSTSSPPPAESVSSPSPPVSPPPTGTAPPPSRPAATPPPTFARATPPPSFSPPPPVTSPPSFSPPPPALKPSPSVPSSTSPPPSRNSPPPGVIQVPSFPNSPSAYSPPPPSQSTLSPGIAKTSPPAPTTSGSTLSPPTPTPPTSILAPASNSSFLASSPAPTPTSKATTNSAFPSADNSSSGSSSAVTYGIATGVVGLAFMVGFIVAFVLIRKQKKKEACNTYVLPSPYSSSQGSDSSFLKHQSASSGDFVPSSSDLSGLGNAITWFSYEELSDATDGFATENVLGAGGFGWVYKGYLADGREVAVKKLKAGAGQGDREFKAEVEIISRVHHRYLVSLVGYCINEYERLLVYEFVQNNTLYYHVHGANKPVMEWALRVKVAAGSARGIAYLHEDCHPRIIHRDIKSANILLDNNFEAKVADFGLAKLADKLDGNTHVSTRVMGTFGYMAPEYASSGKLTAKSDVYSFGVVLLELITGRKPVDDAQPLGDESLVEWARPLLTQALDNENFDEVADPRLEGNYVQSEMFRMIEAAAACVRHSALKRPKMSQVVRALDTLAESSSDLSNGMKPGQSVIFDSREQSGQIRMFHRMACGSDDYSNLDFYNNSQSSLRSGRTGL